MTPTPDRFSMRPDVILLPVEDGSARLLDMGGSFFALSRSGAGMLRSLLADGRAATLAATAARYGIPRERAEADLAALIARLTDARLLSAHADRAGRTSRRAALARRVVPAALRLSRVRSSPRALLALARLCFVTLGWAETVTIWRAACAPLAATGTADPEPSVVESVDTSIRAAAAGLPSVACKERALCAWFMLAGKGVASRLIVGIQLYPLAGHCWCEVGRRIVSDFADHCQSYMPVARYEAGA